MFEPTSRYFDLEDATLAVADPDGRPRAITYKRRRFLPGPPVDPPLAEHAVVAGQRHDQVTARYLGDGRLFWQIADVNLVMRPEELTAEPGDSIVIHLSLGGGS